MPVMRGGLHRADRRRLVKHAQVDDTLKASDQSITLRQSDQRSMEVRGTPYLIHCRSFGVTYRVTRTPGHA